MQQNKESIEVVVSLFLVPDPLATSYYIAENLCWLRGYSLYLGFLLPMGLLLLYNGTIFVLVFREITVKRVGTFYNVMVLGFLPPTNHADTKLVLYCSHLSDKQ